MTGQYPKYEKCHTKTQINGEYCKCLMDKYNLCPQKKLCFGIVICLHPDNYKFATGETNKRRYGNGHQRNNGTKTGRTIQII